MLFPSLPTPDALFFPAALKRGATFRDRLNSVADVAEPLLGVDRSKGECAHIHDQHDGWLFITKDPEDRIYFPAYPDRHPKAGQPRYAWVNHPGGIRLGYLVPEAKEFYARRVESAETHVR